MPKVQKMDGTAYDGEFDEPGGPSFPPDPRSMDEATERAVKAAKAYMESKASAPDFIPPPEYGGWSVVNKHALALYKMAAPEPWAASLIGAYCYHWPDGEQVVEAAKRVRAIYDSARYRSEPFAFDGGKFTLQKFSDLQKLPPVEWLVDQLIIQGGLFVCYAEEKVGKTTLLVDLALCRATGRDFCAMPMEVGPVVYVIAEGNDSAFRDMITAWIIAHSKPGKDRKDLLALIDENFRCVMKPVKMSNPVEVEGFMESIAWLQEKGKGFVVIDTMLRNLDGNVSDPEVQSAFVDGCDNIRRTIGATVAVAHHKSNKNGARDMFGGKGLAFSMDGAGLMTAKGTEVILKPERLRNADSDQQAFVFHRQVLDVPHPDDLIGYTKAHSDFDDLDAEPTPQAKPARAAVLIFKGRKNTKEQDDADTKAAVDNDPPFKVLAWIGDNPGKTLREIAEGTDLSYGTVQRIVSTARAGERLHPTKNFLTKAGERWLANTSREETDAPEVGEES